MVSLTKAAYVYVADTPLNGTDPSGLDGCPGGWQPFRCGSIGDWVWGQAQNGNASNFAAGAVSSVTGGLISDPNANTSSSAYTSGQIAGNLANFALVLGTGGGDLAEDAMAARVMGGELVGVAGSTEASESLRGARPRPKPFSPDCVKGAPHRSQVIRVRPTTWQTVALLD